MTLPQLVTGREALRVRVVESRNWDRELDRISGTNRATGSWNLPGARAVAEWAGVDRDRFTHPFHLTPMPVNVVSETVVVPGDFDGDGVRDLLLGLVKKSAFIEEDASGESLQILSSLAETRLDSAGIGEIWMVMGTLISFARRQRERLMFI